MLTLILISFPQIASQLFSVQAQEAHGPRCSEGLEVCFYEDSIEAYAALQVGEIDLFQWSLDYDQYQYASNASHICFLTAFTFDPNIDFSRQTHAHII